MHRRNATNASFVPEEAQANENAQGPGKHLHQFLDCDDIATARCYRNPNIPVNFFTAQNSNYAPIATTEGSEHTLSSRLHSHFASVPEDTLQISSNEKAIVFYPLSIL